MTITTPKWFYHTLGSYKIDIEKMKNNRNAMAIAVNITMSCCIGPGILCLTDTSHVLFCMRYLAP